MGVLISRKPKTPKTLGGRIRKPKRPMTASRGSVRLVSRRLRMLELPVRARRNVNAALERGEPWTAVRAMYPLFGTKARDLVSPAFRPQVRANSGNRIVRGVNTSRPFSNAVRNGTLVDILQPLNGGNRGGVNPNYTIHQYRVNPIKYAVVGPNRKLKGIALLVNRRNGSRYIDVIAGFKGVGHVLMNRILANAKSQGKKYVNLSAVAHNPNIAQNSLVKWYMAKGFKLKTGMRNKNNLVPMRHTFH